MKFELLNIYKDVSSGKLTQKEALEKIKAVKQQSTVKTEGILLAKSGWMPIVLDGSSDDKIEYEHYHLLLCEISQLTEKQINSSLSSSKIWRFQIDQKQSISDRFQAYALSCFELIQNILTDKPGGQVLIQLVVPNEEERIILAGLSGLLKTAALENPLLVPQLILVDPKVTANDLIVQLKDNQSNPNDEIIKYDQGIRYVLKREEIEATQVHPKIVFKDQGVYLITGGMGGLGLLFAKEILKQTTQSHIILTGRSSLTAEKKALLESLPIRENKVEYQQLELDNVEEVTKAISGIVKEKGGLQGILHCAGMTSDNFIIKKTVGEFSSVLSPKVIGTYNLDQSSKDIDLDFMVLFSSVASQLGNVGQSDYAAANGFMDEFAIYRNQQVTNGHRKGHTVSINWPLWKEGGMQIDEENQESLRRKFGMYPMPANSGIDAFYKILELGYGQALVVGGNLTQIKKAFLENQEKAAKPILEFTNVEQQVVKTINTESLQEKTEKYLCDQFAVSLKLASHSIDPNAPLEKYGIDSILAMSLTDQLEKTFDSLPKTLFFEYQTIQELAEYFLKFHTSQLSKLFILEKKVEKKVVKEASKQEIGSEQKIRLNRKRRIVIPKETSKSIASDPIAIVGLSGRYPESENIDAFWNNLREGKDCITEVPKDRWDWRDYYSDDRTESGRHYSKWGGFIAGVDEFDPRFFNISPREASNIDPQERLFLQHVWMAIEDAGYTRSSLQIPHKDGLPGQVGVYVGMMYSEYQLFGAEESMKGNPMSISGSYASIANRVSYFLNLHGPSMTLDTMCSSSLTAIHLACQDLKEGRTDLGIAGGVNVSVHPNKYLMLSTGQFISSDGHCQSFGEGGDGYIPGEGVGTVILKRLSEAERDGNHIYGIIKGSSLNHGGKTNGYSVPNPKAQAGAIRQALAMSGTDPRHISYIEAHGTGTKLGDPIEISALTKAFEGDTDDIKTGYCQIGSAKSNIGHCESAAGIAGVTKVLLQMRYRQIVPSLHSSRLNPHIDFDKTPFIVNQELQDWDAPVLNGKELPRIAGISSFGAGGSNAHLIIEEYIGSETPFFNGSDSEFMILLSAKKPLQLEQKANDLLNFIGFTNTEENPLDLSAMSYTLQVGRESMDERVGFVVSSVDELIQKLESYLKGTDDITGIYRGQVKRDRDLLSGYATEGLDLVQMVHQWIKDRNYASLIEVWSKGQDIDWQRLYVNTHPKLMSLPTYPFARERYWIDIVDSKESVKGKVTSVLHPLLHRNISDLSYQIYSSTFRGDEFYTSGSGKNELSVPVYLEMARAALTDSLPEKESFLPVEFRDVVWTGPVPIKESLRVAIALLPESEEVIDFEIYHPEGEEELVYCQGSSVISTGSPKAILDIVALKKQIGNEGINSAYDLSLSEVVGVYGNKEELLIELTLPESLISGEDIYRLDPTMFENALQLGGQLLSGGDHQIFIPIEIASLKIIDSCPREVFIWIRPSSQTDTLDIDLCNKQGEVCVQIKKVYYELTDKEIRNEVDKKEEVSSKSLLFRAVENQAKELSIPTRITNTTERSISKDQDLDKESLSKPANISLQNLHETQEKAIQDHVIPKAQFSLATTGTISVTLEKSKAISDIKLYNRGQGVYSLEVATELDNLLSEELTGDLVHSLNHVKDFPGLKVLIIRGTNKTFFRGGRDSYNECLTQGLYNAVTSFPYPVIAEMQGDAMGAGFLLGALCDFMVFSKESRYSYADVTEGLFPGLEEGSLFEKRFGAVLSRDFLYRFGVSTGNTLNKRGWSTPIVTSDQVSSYTEDLVRSLSEKPQNSLRLLKQHLIRDIAKQVTELKQINTFKTEESLAGLETKLTTRSKYLQLETSIEGVLTIKIDTGAKNYKLKTLISGISEVLDQVEKTPVYKVLILSSADEGFLKVPNLSTSLEEIIQLQEVLIGASVPVISVLERNTRDLGWLIAQSCDVCIYHTDGAYCAPGLIGVPELGRLSLPFFNRGLGPYLSQEVLLTGREYGGLDLQEHTGSVLVSSDPMTEALEQAGYWSSLPLDVIKEWKKAQASEMRAVLKDLPLWSIKEEEVSTFPDEPTRIALPSEVIKATLHPEGIVEIRMEDREARNMFSDAFIEGMIEVFDHISESSTYKVVILTGYDSYFASGGTKESLVAIQEGKARFTDTRIFQLALDCNIPVIAAMQGHGIGAGWSMGMFSDFPILSKESHYVSPYMNYGFTPGAGATLIFPERIGHDLARGTLLTGIEYVGQALKEKGIPLPVVSRKEIHEFVFTLARELTRNSRSSLIAFKDQKVRYIKDRLEDICAQELSMHDETFVGSSDTLKRIEGNFNTTTASGKDPLPLTKAIVSTPVPVSQGKYTLPMIIADLKTLLAGELHLEEEEIDEDSQFVDLGLDSIVGVTFIRKINDNFGISLQATIVYSYATLSALSSYVLEEIGQEEKEEVSLIEQPVSTIASTKAVTTGVRKQSDILSDVRRLLAAELHLEEEEIDEDSQFVDLGLDSIVGVTFIRKINEKFGISLQATIVYSYATPLLLSEYIQGELGVEEEEVHTPVVNSFKKEKTVQVKQFTRRVLTSIRNGISSRRGIKRTEKDSVGAIAIIGMSGQFPKAEDVDVFWQNITEGRDCISEIPGDRWDIDRYYQQGGAVAGKTYSKWMGALEGYDLFDPMFFNISPVEAESMDPQQRLFLQSCWHTMENSGYNPHSFSGTKCGVYVGCAYGDYQMLSREDQLSAQGFTGGSTSILAARISYFLNLQGPCISMDTACSSSLVAIANACDALISGSIDSALAGGVYVMAGPDMHIKAAQSGMLSPDGKCHTFDQHANGFVPGEGVGAVMLKRVEDAEKDGDNILGLIRGWGVNQDGKTNGITAPNTESQTQLEQQVYDQFGIDPNSIQLIEAHGTGTKLGDPIEIEGLRKTFKKYTQEKEYCALGSVKSNIGHCLTAAGVAGVIKVVQSLKHQQLPPTINFGQLNEHISLDDSPFYVNTKLRDWKIKEGQQRQAAISSFGFSGTNAHLVLQEYVPDSRKAIQKPVQVIRENGAFMIPLSARSEEQLQQNASNLLRFIEERKGTLDLIEMAYTLQVGREAMEERLGLMIRDENELIEKLQDYIQGKENIAGVYRGQVKRNKEGLRIISHDDEMRDTIVEKYISQQKLSKLLDLWVKGLEFDWNKLYGSQKPKRISLPVYPFAKERYWIEETIGNTIKEKERNIEVLHPLVHKNISDFSKQCYSTTFSGEEFFLRDHLVFNQKILPGVAYLEMVRVAIEKSMPEPLKLSDVELFNVAWIQPFKVDKKKEINTRLLLDDSTPTEGDLILYEIYSHHENEEIIHFQGQATFSNSIPQVKTNISELREQMTLDTLNKSLVYDVFSKMELQYGPAHQGVVEIYKGDRQVLADITLPAIIETEQNDYILHPSIMDSALQASIGLFDDLGEVSSQPFLPFALGSLRIKSACTKTMVAWIRYAANTDQDSRITKLDIDLFDEEGNICVEIREFAFRVMENSIQPLNKISTNGSINNTDVNGSIFNETYYQELIQSVLNKELSDDEAVELV